MPSWLQMMHQLWGNGSEVTPLFLLLMLIAMVLDYRVLIRAAALPTLPARLPVIVQDPTGAGRRGVVKVAVISRKRRRSPWSVECLDPGQRPSLTDYIDQLLGF
jgi:hypothetical protein